MAGSLAIERDGYRILLRGPERMISEILHLSHFDRLLPGLKRYRISSVVHSLSWDLIIRIFSSDHRSNDRIIKTHTGWDVHLDTNDVDAVLYGFLVPAISACVTRKQWVYVDAAGAYVNNGATLLFGRGKSTTSWHLVRRGVSLIAEDTVLLVLKTNRVVAYGSPTPLRVDARTFRPLEVGVDGPGRTDVTVDGQWVPSATVRQLVYLDPTPGPSSLTKACDTDKRSWIASLCCDRTSGRGKYLGTRYRTAVWSWPQVVGCSVERIADALVRQTSTFRLSGDLAGFASLVDCQE